MSLLDDLVRNAEEISAGYNNYRGILDGTISGDVRVPSGTTQIKYWSFGACYGITSIFLPNTVTTIGGFAFENCRNMKAINVPHGVGFLSNGTFNGCPALETLSLPNTLTSIESSVFSPCVNLKYVTLESGFNCTNLRLNSSDKYSAATIASWLDALYDRTGLSANTLIIGSTNINKLTAEQIAIATNKNWNLA